MQKKRIISKPRCTGRFPNLRANMIWTSDLRSVFSGADSSLHERQQRCLSTAKRRRKKEEADGRVPHSTSTFFKKRSSFEGRKGFCSASLKANMLEKYCEVPISGKSQSQEDPEHTSAHLSKKEGGGNLSLSTSPLHELKNRSNRLRSRFSAPLSHPPPGRRRRRRRRRRRPRAKAASSSSILF